MRKFLLFLSLFFAMAMTTVAQDEVTVTNLSELSDETVYFIESKRCFLMYNTSVSSTALSTSTATGLGTSSVTKNWEDPNQQFNIKTVGGSYYLYSVGAAKYVNKSGDLVASPTDALQITASANGTYNWKLCIGGNGLNSQEPNQLQYGIVVNDWTDEDDGNRYKILDVEASLATLNSDATPELIEEAKAALLTEGLGYPAAAPRAALQAAIETAEATPAGNGTMLEEAIAAYYAATDVVLPEAGKTYTFTAIGTDVELYLYNNAGTLSIAENVGEELPESAHFVCEIDANGKYSFKTADGNYYFAYPTIGGKDWLNEESVTGLEATKTVVCSFDIEKIVYGGNVAVDNYSLFGLVAFKGLRGIRVDNGADEPGYIVVKHSENIFDGAGAPFFNENFTSAFRIDEVAEPAEPISVVAHEIMEGVLTVEFSAEIAGTYDSAAEQVAIVGDDGEPVYCQFEVMGNLLMVLLPEGMADGEYVLAVLDGITSAADGSAVVLHPAYGTGYSFMVGGSTVPEALTVTVTSPTEAVESLETITLTFNKPIFDLYDEESEAYIYVDSEDNKCSYAAIDEVVTLTLLNPITTPGEHVIYIPTGVLTALGGDVVEVMDGSLVVTVSEPAASVIYPAVSEKTEFTATYNFADPTTLTPSISSDSFDGNAYNLGETVFTQDGVSISTTSVASTATRLWNSSGKIDLRIYKNSSMTITAPEGYNITEIAVTGKKTTALNVDSGDYSNNTWTGRAESVTFTATDTQQFSTITVTATPDATGDAVAAPLFSTTAGITVGLLYNPTTVLLTAAEGATIYYVTDDSELSSNSNVYTQPIELGYGVTNIKAFAVLDGVASAAFEAVYNVMVAAPKFSLAAGAYAQGTELEISSETTDATIAVLSGYQLSNDIKALSSYYYKAGVTTKTLNSTSEFKAIARVITAENDTLWSDIVTAKYYASEVLPYKVATAVENGANYVLNYNNTVITPVAENLNYDNLVAVEGALENGYVKTLAHYAFTITAVEGAEDTYTIQDVYGRYLYDTDDTYSTFNVAAEKPETGAEWVITFTDGGKATIKNTLTELYLSYYASKKHFNLYSNAAEVTLCAQSEYPTFTTVPTGEYDETLTSISTVTIACERGLALADGAAAVTLVANGDYDNVYTGTATLADDGNSISVSFGQEFTANGDYEVTIPAGMFYMEPDGLNVANEETVLDLNIYVATPLEVVSITPAAGEVEALSVIKIEFNQDVNNGTDMPVVTDANGSEYTFMQLYYDEENSAEIPANEVWFVAIDNNYEPVTIDAAGTYTLNLSTFTVYPVGVWTPLTFTGTTSYSWTIAEAVEPATQYYRIYSTSQSKYLHIESYNASNTSGTKGAVGLSNYVDAEANPEQSANQIFKLEDAGNGLVYLVSANEYYIVCRPWNVDACNNGQKSALGMDYISETEFRLLNGSQYFKVGEVDGEWGAYYPYCDAPFGLAETWRLEPATVPTGIENVITEGAVVEGIYDITGRKIEAITAPGIYIVNGKKVLVK